MQSAMVLAFDIGTSGVKTSLIDSDGAIAGAKTVSYDTHYAQGGIAEQNPLDWYDGIVRATNALKEELPEAVQSIAAIGVSGHMMGCIPVDAKGNALHPALIHSDSRALAQHARVLRDVGRDELYRMCGNVPDARGSLCKMLWFMEERPEIYRRAAKFLQSKDYIVSQLTGNIDTTDCSDACHGLLMDITARKYDPALFQTLGLDMQKLPEIHKGCEIVGTVCDEAARLLGIPSGIPVIAGGGDGACGSMGAASIKAGDAYLNLGTTAWFASVVEKPILDSDMRVFNITNLDGETTSVYGTMQSAGSSINKAMEWFSVSSFDQLNAMALKSPCGANGLIYLPYLEGERSPIFDARAKGVFLGMTMQTGADDYVRAVFEGTCYALRQIADVLREYIPLSRVKAIGGGMKSSAWPQMIADIARLDLETLSVPSGDSTSRGIAAVAGTAAGIFPSIEDALSHVRVTGEIRMQEEKEEYERNYSAYKKLYPALSGIMRA
ncbi:MAG: xylulokinase [Christensenellales bacterium]|jgi:xylulokinase